MSGSDPDRRGSALQRRQNAAILLSSVGAAVAGAGLGMMVVSLDAEHSV